MINKVRKLYKKVETQIPQRRGFLSQTALVLDYVFCKFRYKVSFTEYRQYSFYQLKHHEKKAYITENDVLHVIPERFNRGEQRKILDDKAEFDRFFSDILGRDYGEFSAGKQEQFLQFTEGKSQIIVKPLDSWCGHGVQKYDVPDNRDQMQALFEQLVKDYGTFVAEEFLVQHERMGALNPDTVNTLRVISIADAQGDIHVPFASVRIGRAGAVVDNFCAGGMAASIDVTTGEIISGAFDGAGTQYLVHPDTGVELIGYQIPCWEDVLRSVERAAKRLPEMRFIGWDVVVRKDGKVCLLEGNSNPGARTIQMPLKRGIKPDYQKYLGKF